MAGKHRKVSRRKSRVSRRWVPGLTAAAVKCHEPYHRTVDRRGDLNACAAGQRPTTRQFHVPDLRWYDLLRHGLFEDVRHTASRPVFPRTARASSMRLTATGAIRTSSSCPPDGAPVETGTALGIMNANNDPALSNLKLVILDNNSNRAGGGFWTTYYPFAPLLLTSAEPTPKRYDRADSGCRLRIQRQLERRHLPDQRRALRSEQPGRLRLRLRLRTPQRIRPDARRGASSPSNLEHSTTTTWWHRTARWSRRFR